MTNPNTIEITGHKTIIKLCQFGAENGMERCSFAEIVEKLFSEYETAKKIVILENDYSANYQARVQPWLNECFGEMIAGDREERNHRFLEEALELVQSTGCTASEAHQLVDYVFNRPIGEPSQEVGGVMVTLAALCLAHKLDMHQAGETELKRINQPETLLKVRAKQAAKPKHSPLPEQSEIDPTEKLATKLTGSNEPLNELGKLAVHVQEAIRIGKEASEKSTDGGSANLDHVVLTDLKGVRLQALTSLGIPASKGRHPGYFPLDTFFGGQGDKNAIGVKAMSEYLTRVGVAHYVHYQLD